MGVLPEKVLIERRALQQDDDPTGLLLVACGLLFGAHQHQRTDLSWEKVGQDHEDLVGEAHLTLCILDTWMEGWLSRYEHLYEEPKR